MEINIKPAKVNIDFSVQKVFPELEDIEITPKGVEQNFKSNKYGYNNIKVKKVELQPNKVVAPTEQKQIVVADSEYSGLNQVEVEPIPLRKDEYGGYDWIIEPSFEKDQEFYFNGEYIKQVIVPRAYDAFSKRLIERTITSITDNTIYSIGAYAFYGCLNLNSVNLPNVTTIGSNGLSNCQALTEIILPNVKEVQTYGLSGCTSLKEINLPKLEKANNYSFSNCTNVKKIILPNLTSMMGYTFYGLTACKLIQLDSWNMSAGTSQYFQNTTGRIVLPSLTQIYNYSFRNSQFSEIVLPQNRVVVINHYGAFNGSSMASGTCLVYVPDDLVESYKTATNWSTYADQIKPISELPVLEV